MRIMTVRQPWAWAIIHGGKNVENRSRNIAGAYRGPVAIHAALACAADAPDDLWMQYSGFLRARDRAAGLTPLRKADPLREDRGVIIGVVDLVDVHESDYCFDAEGHLTTGAIGFCSPWADPNKRHLVLANPRPLSEPIPYKGALGLRRFNETVDAAILRKLAEVR